MATDSSEVAAPALFGARLRLVFGATDVVHRPRHTLDSRSYRTGIDVHVVTSTVCQLVQIGRLNLKALAPAGRRIDS